MFRLYNLTIVNEYLNNISNEIVLDKTDTQLYYCSIKNYVNKTKQEKTKLKSNKSSSKTVTNISESNVKERMLYNISEDEIDKLVSDELDYSEFIVEDEDRCLSENENLPDGDICDFDILNFGDLGIEKAGVNNLEEEFMATTVKSQSEMDEN
ncbi:unnamed protein product [Brachionus calyciflorus]|nr:unnamed protein product [Brachionus calyciflorus]